ncbi:PREDICTED: stefin-C-like [Myotis davidii]|uniref:stefin-C-like n=1 Tax=Myotis davidii TaxID=225400 RepID=UPI000767D529|nr:PREDICTED: stefin-C-like [Myotis davidii]
MSASEDMLGGLTETRAATTEIQAIAHKMQISDMQGGLRATPVKGSFDRQRGRDPQVENCCPEGTQSLVPQGFSYTVRQAQGLGVRGSTCPPHSTLSLQVQVADDDYVHLRVFQGLPPERETILSKYQTHKTKQDELVYF